MSSEQSTSTDQWTVRRILEWTTGYLAEHGSESPRLDAEILLAHARGCPRIRLYTDFDAVLPEEIRATMRNLVQRRAKLEPVAYLVGRREFFSLGFEVTPDVFIPRPETETLVMETLAEIRGRTAPRILELCSGSGCIPVAIAANSSAAHLIAVERSTAALDVARRNAVAHHVADRVTFLEGDLFGPLQDESPFDVVVSNPPYIAAGESERLQPDVRLHEPHDALFSGGDGLDVIRRIVSESPAYLVPGGLLLIEFSPEQADEITRLFAASGRFCEVTILPDLSDQARAVRARRNE